MPADHGFGFDNDENFGPTGPATTEGNPEDPVPPVQWGSRTLAFEHGDLLPQGEDLESVITSGLKERAERGKAREDRFDQHEPILFNMAQTWIRLFETCWRKFLILGQDQVLATNSARRTRFSAAKYSFWRSSSWLTRPVT
jgi:hypothetical protein